MAAVHTDAASTGRAVWRLACTGAGGGLHQYRFRTRPGDAGYVVAGLPNAGCRQHASAATVCGQSGIEGIKSTVPLARLFQKNGTVPFLARSCRNRDAAALRL